MHVVKHHSINLSNVPLFTAIIYVPTFVNPSEYNSMFLFQLFCMIILCTHSSYILKLSIIFITETNLPEILKSLF